MSDIGQRVQVVLVPVPIEAGSPKVARDMKPGPYPQQRREHWQPRTSPPVNRKAEGLQRLLDEFQRQDRVVREMMRPGAP
jgi:hypothetical protein